MRKAPQPVSLDELRVRRALETSAATRIIGRAPLPEIAPVSLEGIRCRLSDPTEVTLEDVLARMQRIIADHAPRRRREAGEVIAPGDVLTLNIVGYSRGALIPFTVHREITLRCEADVYLPGFMERLRGAVVGQTLQVSLPLPADFARPAFRGQTATFAVQLLAAAEILTTELNTEVLDEMRADVEQMLLREALDAALTKALEQVFTQIADRSPPNIPETLVDQELGRRWRRSEGEFLAEIGVPPREAESALEGWLNDADMRRGIRDHLARTQALVAVAIGESLTPTSEDLEKYIVETAEEAEVDPNAVLKELHQSPEDALEMKAQVLLGKALNHVISRCIESPPSPPG